MFQIPIRVAQILDQQGRPPKEIPDGADHLNASGGDRLQEPSSLLTLPKTIRKAPQGNDADNKDSTARKNDVPSGRRIAVFIEIPSGSPDKRSDPSLVECQGPPDRLPPLHFWFFPKKQGLPVQKSKHESRRVTGIISDMDNLIMNKRMDQMTRIGKKTGLHPDDL